MFTEFSPLISLGLTIVTDSMIVEGTLPTRRTRLTDLLNDPGADYLILNDAEFMELGSRRIMSRGGLAQIRVSDILFAHVSQKTESDASMRMPKQPVKATLMLPPFTIEGTIYLPYESELRIALAAYSDKFEPVTDATYRAYGIAETLRTVDFLAVNHARAHVSVAADTPWNADAGPADASHPW